MEQIGRGRKSCTREKEPLPQLGRPPLQLSGTWSYSTQSSPSPELSFLRFHWTKFALDLFKKCFIPLGDLSFREGLSMPLGEVTIRDCRVEALASVQEIENGSFDDP